MNIILKLLIFGFFVECIIFIIELVRKPPRSGSVRIFFGLPGSGKTTFAASFVYKRIKKGQNVWSNVPIKGAKVLDVKSDLGVYQLENGYLIVDEAGIDYNNRQFSKGKGMSDDAIKWWKLIRHYHMSADIFSQSFEDMDITLRRLAHDLYIIRRSAVPCFFICKKIKRRDGIDEVSHKPIDEYSWGLPVLDTYRIYGPKYRKFFDSYEAPPLQEKEWQHYN